jgi:hypothetical protein
MMTIDLPPDIEARLKGEANRRGLKAEDYAQKLIVEHLPLKKAASSLAELFSEWTVEDGTSDPAEIARRNEEVEEFKQAMKQNRLEMEGPNSRRPFP